MKSYHLIGIGGIGMSALARLLVQKGYRVAGSDTGKSSHLEDLRELGINIFTEHDAQHVASDAQVIYSTSIKPSNPEFSFAKEKKLPLLHRAELLNQLMIPQKSLLITGAHGKTSTSAMLYHLLSNADLEPSCALGGMLSGHNTNANIGKGEYFVAEADESDGSFLKMQRYGAIVTNVEAEHMDYWKSFPRLCQGYLEFISKVENKDLLFLCGEDPFLFNLGYEKHYYGFSPHNSLQIVDVVSKDQGSMFSLQFEGKTWGPFFLPLSGRHYVLNASAALGMAIKLGAKEDLLIKGLKSFKGVQRRLEMLAETPSTIVYDDYAHHPTEVAATLEGLKERLSPDQKLIAVLQPHRFSRLADQFERFCTCFSLADRCIVTDVYAAGEIPIDDIDGKTLAKYLDHKDAHYEPLETLLDFLKNDIKKGNVYIFMGAGNITSSAHEFANFVKNL